MPARWRLQAFAFQREEKSCSLAWTSPHLLASSKQQAHPSTLAHQGTHHTPGSTRHHPRHTLHFLFLADRLFDTKTPYPLLCPIYQCPILLKAHPRADSHVEHRLVEIVGLTLALGIASPAFLVVVLFGV